MIELTTNHSKASDFIKAYINHYSNEILVNKVKTLYNISEEDIQELIHCEELSLQQFLDTNQENWTSDF